MMSKKLVQNKYTAGDHVYAKVKPSLELVIKRYIDHVYYCEIHKDPTRKELAYYEKELVENPAMKAKNKKEEAWENEGGAMLKKT